MGKVLGYTRITVPGRTELNNQPAVIKVGGKLLEDKLEDIELNGKGKDAVNPFKGWFTPDTLPAQGSDGDYCYVTDDGVSTIYKWNGEAFVDSEEPVDTSFVQTFATSQSVNNVKIDNTGLENPTTQDETNAPVLAKATDVRNVNQKLAFDFSEEKVGLVTSGAGQNVFDGYVLVKRGYVSDTPYYERQNECPLIYTNNLHPEYKHVVVDVADCDSVRFMARVGSSSVPDQGWAFFDESNYYNGHFLDDNTGYIQYSPFDSADEVGYKQYIVSVPEGAKYMKISYLTQTELDNAYIYLRYGHAVLGDSVNKNRHVVKNLLDYGNFIRGSYILDNSGWKIPETSEFAKYGVMSNKLYLEEGQTYTISNAVVNSNSSTIRIVRFTEEDEYMTYFGVPARKTDIYSGTTTSVWKDFGFGTFTYHNIGESYVRILIRANVGFGDNDGSSPTIVPHAQLEIGSQVTDFARFNEVEDYDLASGQFERDAKAQLKVYAYEDIDEGSFHDFDVSGVGFNYGVADYRRGHSTEEGNLRLVQQSNLTCKVFKVTPYEELYFSCDVYFPGTGINACNYALQFVDGTWEDDELLGEIFLQDDQYTPPDGITWVKHAYHITVGADTGGKRTVYKHNRIVVPENCHAIIMNAYNNTFKIQRRIEVDSSLQDVYDYIDETSQNKSTKQTINILSIGNSGSQDSLAYVPFLIHDIAPDVNVNIGIAMLSSSGVANHLNNFNYAITPYDVSDPTGFHFESTIGVEVEDEWVKMYNNGQSYTYFHCSSNEGSWTQESGLKTIQEIIELEKWDVVLFNVTYTNPGYEGDPTNNVTGYDDLNAITDKIMQVVQYPVRFGIINTANSVVEKNGKFYDESQEGHGAGSDYGLPIGDYGTLKQRALNRSISGKRIIEGWDLVYDNSEHADGYDGKIHETLCDFMFPVNTAIENALTVQTFRNMGDYSKHLNNTNYIDESDHELGKEGYLRAPDGVHLQEGLPCQIAAYAVICKILEMSDMPYKSILGDASVCNSDWTRGRSIPGPHPDETCTKYTSPVVQNNAHTGWVTGGDEEEDLAINLTRARFAQKCAVMACKHPYQITDMSQYYTEQ